MISVIDGSTMTTLPISPAYRKAVKVAVPLQVMATLFLLTILDGGMLAKAGGAAMIGFWAGVSLVMLRRPRNPDPLDLLYVRWGYLPMLIVGIACTPLMGTLR
jgi:hypothetical protein